MPVKNKENELEANDATIVVDLEESKTSKKAVAEDATVKVAEPTTKQVRIKTFEKVDCIVGKVAYKIDKDKEALVPTDVAAILVSSKKAYRL